jgi:hypothetical protein
MTHCQDFCPEISDHRPSGTAREGRPTAARQPVDATIIGGLDGAAELAALVNMVNDLVTAIASSALSVPPPARLPASPSPT